MIRLRLIWAALTFALLASGPAGAAPCRLALALALDVSSSVDAREYGLQSRGLAAALDRPATRRAILSGGAGVVKLAVYEWSGQRQHALLLDWTVLDSEGAIDRAVAALGRANRSHDDFPTALGYALGYGASLLGRGGPCARRVLDVSGDGENNAGFAPFLAYKHFPFSGVTVNGLAIAVDGDSPAEYYWRNVTRGPGAFVELADGFEDFERAMARKLLRELGTLQMSGPARTGPGPV